jgi:hypothetical protein
LLIIAMRRLWSQSPCAYRRAVRDSAKRAANLAHVSPHPSPAWQSVRTRQRGSQIDPIYIQGRSFACPPTQRAPRSPSAELGPVRTSRGRLATLGYSQSHQAHRRCSILNTVLISRPETQQCFNGGYPQWGSNFMLPLDRDHVPELKKRCARQANPCPKRLRNEAAVCRR